MTELIVCAALVLVAILACAAVCIRALELSRAAADRDGRIIKQQSDIICLSTKHDLQLTRIEHETVGTGLKEYNRSVRDIARNGTMPMPDLEPGETRIPSHGEIE